MRKIKLLFVALAMFAFTFQTFAGYLNFWDFVKSYFGIIASDIPESYKYIEVKYTNVSQDPKLYDSLQRAIYMGYFPNSAIDLPLEREMTQGDAVKIIEQNFDVTVNSYIKDKWVDIEWLKKVVLWLNEIDQSNNDVSEQWLLQQRIMENVYTTLKLYHIDSDQIDDVKMFYSAIKWLVQWIGDDYTVYFPPQEAESFNDSLEGKYEGIWAYIEQKGPGEIIIVSPIKWSPASERGLMPGDIIIKVDNHDVKRTTTVREVGDWIRWPANSKVNITIIRAWQEIEKTLTRKPIVIDAVEYEYLENNMCLVTLVQFDTNIAYEFDKAMANALKDGCDKFIFDVRNNPGGSLQEVVAMLDYFVPTGSNSVVVKSKTDIETYTALDSEVKLNNNHIVILTNKWSASASEIFAGTVSEYNDKVLLIGEETYGKGSVQSLLEYADGSMLKYTMARWYTGKDEVNVDKDGIDPDVEVIDKEDTERDETLEYAKLYLKSK